MAGQPTERDWAIRTAIYQFHIEHARVPSYEEMAAQFDIEPSEARDAFRALHEAHTLLLEPGTDRIRMINPFSAVETAYRVEIGDKSYYANCAWDMLGIPAMLGQDALVYSRLEVADRVVEIPVTGGEPRADSEYIINFSVPFRHWYEDQIHT